LYYIGIFMIYGTRVKAMHSIHVKIAP
jgi:hypothetical protein